jgi:flagellar protein FliO/FliZ
MSSGATLELFARLIISLGFVIGLMWFAARVVRRRGLGGAASGARRSNVSVDIVARRTLGRNASIAIVRTGNQAMVIGVTDHMVTKLADTDLDAIELDNAGDQWTAPASGPTGPAPSWKAMLNQMRDKTART